jgi:hypothetical protein
LEITLVVVASTGGSSSATLEVVTQPFASVTDTVYTPAKRLAAVVASVEPVVHEYV